MSREAVVMPDPEVLLAAVIVKARRKRATTGLAGMRVFAGWDGPGNSDLHGELFATLILRALLVATDCAFLLMQFPLSCFSNYPHFNPALRIIGQ